MEELTYLAPVFALLTIAHPLPPGCKDNKMLPPDPGNMSMKGHVYIKLLP